MIVDTMLADTTTGDTMIGNMIEPRAEVTTDMTEATRGDMRNLEAGMKRGQDEDRSMSTRYDSGNNVSCGTIHVSDFDPVNLIVCD